MRLFYSNREGDGIMLNFARVDNGGRVDAGGTICMGCDIMSASMHDENGRSDTLCDGKN